MIIYKVVHTFVAAVYSAVVKLTTSIILSAPVGVQAVLVMAVQVEAFKVVQSKLRFVQSVISSIAQELAVLLHSNLPVFIVTPFVVTLQAFTIFTHSIATTQALTLVSVVSVACHSSILHTHNAVVVDDVIQETGNQVQFVSVQVVGVHKAQLICTNNHTHQSYIDLQVA